MSDTFAWYWFTLTAANTTLPASAPGRGKVSTYSCETMGQMSVQCGSMNSRTTTLPRSAESARVRPSWSVSVKPSAGRTGPVTGPSS